MTIGDRAERSAGGASRSGMRKVLKLGILLVVGLWAGTVGAVEAPGKVEGWAQADSKHFRVYLEKADKITPGEVVGAVEAFSAAADKDLGLQMAETEPVAVYVFSTKAGLVDYLAGQGQSRTAEGWCHCGNGSAFITTYRRERETFETLCARLRHEVTHLVLFRDAPKGEKLPTWLNEGLAVYYEDAKMGEAGNIAGVKLNEGRLHAIRGAIRVGMTEPLKKHLERREGEHWDGTKSLQSWSVVLWLKSTIPEKLGEYVRSAGGEKDTVGWFEKVMGMKVEEGEKEWKEYMLGARAGKK